MGFGHPKSQPLFTTKRQTKAKMKYILLSVFLTTFSQISFSDVFTKQTQLTKIMAFAQDTEHSANECVLYFGTDAKSVCSDKKRAVINTETEIGKLMCSMALTAFIAGKSVELGSYDDCSPTHNAPFLRHVRVIN